MASMSPTSEWQENAGVVSKGVGKGNISSSVAKARAKRRSTLTREEFAQLGRPSPPKQQQQRRRRSSALSGIDPMNIIIDDPWSVGSQKGTSSSGGGTSSKSPSPSSAESQERANALSAELDRILGSGGGGAAKGGSGGVAVRRSLRRKSFSLSSAISSSAVTATASGQGRPASAAPCGGQRLLPDDATQEQPVVVIQLYKQDGTYKPPKPKPLGTIPEAAAGRASGASRHRRINFDSPARLTAKERSRCKKAQKLLAAGSRRSTPAASSMDMDEFRAFLDGLNL